MLLFRPMAFPFGRGAADMIHVEEYREDGTLVARADLPGIDPDKDVELTISQGMLHIEAERREEEKREGKGREGLLAPGGALRVVFPVAAAS